jgi:glycosyltransferase involved in cell wall biosynthesis
MAVKQQGRAGPASRIDTPSPAAARMQTHICVCVCTYKRPAMLATLLHVLGRQQTDGLFSYSVVVADNDGAKSAQAVVDEIAATSSVDIVYCVEAEQNIAKARNKAFEHASGDFIAMIDDDEIPPPNWLLVAWRFCTANGVDGVLAPVRPRFEGTPPAWVVKSQLFERPEPPDGHRLRWRETRSGNVLMRRALVAGEAQPFDITFATGSEDKEFFRRLLQRGAIFAWCKEAAVYELVPPERWRRAYVIKRALLRGQNEKRFTDVRGIGKSVIAVPLYAMLLPVLLLFGQHHFMRYLVRLCDHAGKLLMLLRIRTVGKYVH